MPAPRQLLPFPCWASIRASFAHEPKLMPGTPLFQQLQERGWADNSPAALFDRLFDRNLKLNTDALGLDAERIRAICAWVIGYLHYRQCAADHDMQLVHQQKQQPQETQPNSFGWQPRLVTPIRSLQGYAWRLFSTNINTPLSELADERRLREQWLLGRTDSSKPGSKGTDQARLEYPPALSASSCTSNSDSERGLASGSDSGSDTEEHTERHKIQQSRSFVAGFRDTAEALLLNGQTPNAAHGGPCNETIAIPRSKLESLMELLSNLQLQQRAH